MIIEILCYSRDLSVDSCSHQIQCYLDLLGPWLCNQSLSTDSTTSGIATLGEDGLTRSTIILSAQEWDQRSDTPDFTPYRVHQSILLIVQATSLVKDGCIRCSLLAEVLHMGRSIAVLLLEVPMTSIHEGQTWTMLLASNHRSCSSLISSRILC